MATLDPAVFIKNPFSRDPRSRLRSKPKRVERARAKHQQPPQSITQKHAPNLLDRFFALPLELRNHIYRLLLVQPCKWDMRHFLFPTCTPVTLDQPGPSTHWYTNWTDYACAECEPSSWRTGTPVLVSPMRSVWASQQTNPFLCDNCYSEKVRAKRELHPGLRLLKCLCVRRENLHVLLINKRVYVEAARVFWTENTFAFENPVLLGDFLESVSPFARALVRKISLVASAEGGSLEPPRRKDVLRAIYWVRECPGLTELELDEFFLSKLVWVLRVKNVMPKNRVRFIRYEELSRGAFLNDRCRPVWKVMYMRRESEDPLARILATSMLGQRPLTNRAVEALFRRYRISGEKIST